MAKDLIPAGPMEGALRVGRHPSPIGAVLLGWDGQERLRVLYFEDSEDRMRRQLRRPYGAIPMEEKRVPAALAAAVGSYFDGDHKAFEAVALAPAGTPFQRRVWTLLLAIPSGETRTYRQMAEVMGRPEAQRAVGFANGANPISVAIPCHRLIGSNGTLTGYGGGLDRKKWLLAHEGVETVSSGARINNRAAGR